MNQNILLNKLKIFVIVFILLVFLIIIEGSLILNDYTDILRSIIQSPYDLVRYLPIVILLYMFANEIVLSSNRNDPLLKFTVIQKGIVFIQNYDIWFAIFQTFSLRKIQTSELKQLKHLKTFSLELDTEKACIRIFLYSKSYKELKERIKKSKPILEGVLPDIILISNDDIDKLLRENKLVKIRKKYILEENSKFIFPKSVNFDIKSLPFFSRMILAYNFTEKTSIKENNNEKNRVQCYCFHSYNQTSFFKYINKILFNTQNKKDDYFWDIQELERIRLKYQIKKNPKITLQRGLLHFKEGLSLFLTESKPSVVEEKQVSYTPIMLSPEMKPKSLLGVEKTGFSLGMNQICYELCNIPKDTKSLSKEKEKKCLKRVNFCQKLLTNDKLSSIFEIILNQRSEKDKIHLFTELKNHLSYQQLICVLTQLSQSNHLEIPYHEIVNLIYILLRLNDKVQGTPIFNKKLPSSKLLSNDEDFEQISPSLAQK